MQVVIQIVPQVSPVVCGVGDYAALVGRRMEEQEPGLRCGYVACGYEQAEHAQRPLQRNLTGACDAARMWSAVQELAGEINGDGDGPTLVVHYSGYGYSQSGAPGWLAEALERRPVQVATLQVVTMFHELFATGRPWQRAFWNSGRQRDVASRIARASNAVMTNREQSARWLEVVSQRPTGSVPSLPVPSNVGEPESVAAWETRPPRAVAFGGRHNKRFLLGETATTSAALLKEHGISDLIDVGERVAVPRDIFEARGVRVEQLGYCDHHRVSELLLSSRIGFLDYPFDFLSKSGVLAAYAAHGLAILNAARRKDGRDDRLPVHSFEELSNRTSSAPIDLAAAAERAFQWYKGHGSAAHARTILQLATAPASPVHAC
jgi:hypothetical protein